MRFAQKMTLAVTLLLAVFITVGGTLLVRRSFSSALDSAIAQSTSQHLLEKYAIEADLLDEASGGRAPTDAYLRRYADSLTGYFSADERLFALYAADGETLFSNLPAALTVEDQKDALDAGSEGCILRKTGADSYLLMATRIGTPHRALWLLSAFDVSDVFAERDAQLLYLWRIEAVLLALAVALIALMSLLLTRGVKQLSRAAHSIARGAYDQRTEVHGRDEISGLAQDFDAMAEAVQGQVESLHHAVQSRDDFVAAFTHEIKTPMTALVGYAGILRQTEEEPAVRLMAADHIYHEARRLEALSQKLLELMGLAPDILETKAVPFRALYEEAARSLARPGETAPLVLCGDADALVLADRTLAADLLRNLVTNALNAGGERPVRVHARAGRTYCSVLVCDAGRGIPGDELARIVEPFYMVDKSRARKQGGSGVGLALAQRIAGLHGGGLRFKSRVGRGTVVRFTLPLPREEQVKTYG